MDSSACALVVVDTQNGFCDPAGSIPCAVGTLDLLAETINAIGEALDDARSRLMPVIYTAHCFQPGHTDADPATRARFAHDPSHLIKGTWDAAIIPALRPHITDHIVEKNRFDPFVNTLFEALLVELRIRHLLVTGVVANTCVAATARGAWMRDYGVSVPEDTTTSATAVAKQNVFEEFTRWLIDTSPWRRAVDAVVQTAN